MTLVSTDESKDTQNQRLVRSIINNSDNYDEKNLVACKLSMRQSHMLRILATPREILFFHGYALDGEYRVTNGAIWGPVHYRFWEMKGVTNGVA